MHRGAGSEKIGTRGTPVNVRRPYGGGAQFGRPQWPGGRPTPDVTLLVAVLFGTYALQFFEATAIVPALLRLTPALWRAGFLWQLVTYAVNISGKGRQLIEAWKQGDRARLRTVMGGPVPGC